MGDKRVNATELIKRGAKYFAKETAVIFQGERWTFEQVYHNSNRLANALMRLGLRKGERVA
ncbi:MAG: AMP-binding protein, partial [Bacilli bacterium]